MICAVSARVCLVMLRHPHRCRLCALSQAGHDGVARSLARTQRSASTRRSRTQRCGQEHRLDNRNSVEYRLVVGGPASRGGGRRRLPHRCMGNQPLAPTAKPAHDRLPVAAARSSVDANPSPTNPKQRGPQSQPCSTRQYSVPSGGVALRIQPNEPPSMPTVPSWCRCPLLVSARVALQLADIAVSAAVKAGTTDK